MTNPFYSQYISQSNYRNNQEKVFETMNTDVPSIGLNHPHETAIFDYIHGLITSIHENISDTIMNRNNDIFSSIKNQLIRTKKTVSTPSLDDIWAQCYPPISNTIKIYYLKNHSDDILIFFQKKLHFITNKYKFHLPKHVSETEGDDLMTIAQIELLETFKIWDVEKNTDLWPIAYSRITGAMKDHIRHISRIDPGRFYDWVIEAAHLYTAINQSSDINLNIERSSDLTNALCALNKQEQQVIILSIKEDLTFVDIAKHIQRSESQVSRLYKSAVEKLKRTIGKK